MIKMLWWVLTALIFLPIIAFVGFFGSLMLAPVLVPLGISSIPGGCLRQTSERISNVRGLELEVVDVACGLAGSVEWRELRVRYLGKVTRTEIFRYMGDLSPTIKAIDQRTILVAIESVEEIGLQKYSWRDWTIVYDIRATEYSNVPCGSMNVDGAGC